jgi:hypothetical protein
LTASAGLQATVDVARESGSSRIGPRADGADLRVDAGVPLRLALLVERDQANVTSAHAVALGAGADVVLTLASTSESSIIDRATALRDARPDAVLAVADRGDARGLVELIEALRLGCGDRPQSVSLLVASDEGARARIAAGAGPIEIEAIPAPTGARAREAVVARLRAMRRGDGDVVLRDEAIEAAARAIAAATARSVLVVDVDGATTSLAFALPDGGLTAAHARIGIGRGADRVVARAGLERVRRWIPWPIDAPGLLDRVFNRARWPEAVPTGVLTLALEMALARESVAHVLRAAARAGLDLAAMRSAHRVVATGRLARFPRVAQTALVAVDALASEGTQLLCRERQDALVVAGAIATRSNAPIADAIEDIALVATVRPKRDARVTVVDANGTISERVARGAFFLIPTSGAARLELPGSDSAGRHATGPLALGVVIDARGRPLELPQRDAERLPTIARWSSALAALPIEGGNL